MNPVMEDISLFIWYNKLNKDFSGGLHMKRILIVDDSRVSRKMLRNLLELSGYEVVAEAVNGKEGLELFEKMNPDIVLMDITMPEINGIESLRAIKKQRESAKVIIISGTGHNQRKIEAINAGAEIYITKPYDDNEILEALQNCQGS